MLIKLMMRHEGITDIEMLQQDARCTGIFGKDEVDLFQKADGTQCHVLQIAYWRWNNIQYAHFGGQI
jgi:hypothetical protein